MARILIAEDDDDLALGLNNNLEIEGYVVRVARDGAAALQLYRDFKPDLLLLDIAMPRIDGLRVLRELRATDTTLAVLMLTARSSESDKVLGLKLGADDYLAKPFGVLELLARIEALLRRVKPDSALPYMLQFGEVVVDIAARRVTKRGRHVVLRRKEFDLLVELLRHCGQVRTRVQLMQAVWGYSSAVITRTVDTHLFELRRALEEDASTPRHIVTVHGVGYRLDC